VFRVHWLTVLPNALPTTVPADRPPRRFNDLRSHEKMGSGVTKERPRQCTNIDAGRSRRCPVGRPPGWTASFD
jgi:hypothetical protein